MDKVRGNFDGISPAGIAIETDLQGAIGLPADGLELRRRWRQQRERGIGAGDGTGDVGDDHGIISRIGGLHIGE